MSENQDAKISKREYWQDQVVKWKSSNLTQKIFCEQSGISLPTFVYWRCLLLKPENKKINKKFAALKIISDEAVIKPAESIRIKLPSGHIVYLPAGIGINGIARLIHLLESPHA